MAAYTMALLYSQYCILAMLGYSLVILACNRVSEDNVIFMIHFSILSSLVAYKPSSPPIISICFPTNRTYTNFRLPVVLNPALHSTCSSDTTCTDT